MSYYDPEPIPEESEEARYLIFAGRSIAWAGEGFYRLAQPYVGEKTFLKIEETYEAVSYHARMGNMLWVGEESIL